MKQVFLSYARIDGNKAGRLYRDLTKASSVRVWFDRENLLPGLRWKPAIRKAIRESRYFIALLSRSAVARRGFRHTELREALEVVKEFPEDMIFLIPTRLDKCRMPMEEIQEFTYADLFPDWNAGLGDLQKALGIASGSRAIAAPSAGTTQRERANGHKTDRHHYRVGLVDLEACTPDLAKVASGLSAAQSVFALKASRVGRPVKAVKTMDGNSQLFVPALPESFYRRISPLNMDYAMCLTRRFLAFEEKGSIYYNYLTSETPIDERVKFVSHAGLRGYAEQAGVGFDVALAFLITAEVARYFLNFKTKGPELYYHEETRDCPMDFVENHADLVGGLRAGRVCRSCSRQLDKNQELKTAINAMLAWGR